jgi:transposase
VCEIKTPKIRTQQIKGVNYVYEDYPYWNKTTKQNRHKRIYIGKLGQDGEFIPNKHYLSHQSTTDEKKEVEIQNPPARRFYYGATHLLDEISTLLGIKEDLEVCFPDHYKILLSLAYYLVLGNENPLYRFPRWAFDHQHPYGKDLPSQRISELLRDIPESAKLEFFKRQRERHHENEYVAYDTTSVSSYSEYIKAVRYGKNKDQDNLPQINLGLLFGEKSGLPIYYRVLPGNINDVSTMQKLVNDMMFLGIKKPKVVTDRGFCSAKNINELYKCHFKFLVSSKTNNAFVSKLLNKAKTEMRDYRHYDLNHELYCWNCMEWWPYVQKDSSGNTTFTEKRRIYVHIYYNGLRAEEEKLRFNKKLGMTEIAMKNKEQLTKTQKSLCQKYFIVKETPKRGIQIQYKEEEIKKRMDQFGYFVLLSNDMKDSGEAIEIYRRKDVVEKAFDNLKERLNMKRTGVNSDQALGGKFFLQFVALIYISYIHKEMVNNNLYKNYTMQTLFDSLDVIEKYEYDGKNDKFSEITEKQRKIFECFGVGVPNML